MDVQTHPTSPKLRADKGATVAKVWSEQSLAKPIRTPWFRIFLFVLLLNIISVTGLLVGWGWLSRNAPRTSFLRWLPVLTATTVVQQTQVTPTDVLPSAVKDRLDTQVGLALDQGTSGLYSEQTITGRAVPLSSSGWMLALTEAVPAKNAAAIVSPGQKSVVSSVVADSLTPVSFLKIDQLDAPPATIAADPPHVGQRVWVVVGSFQVPVASSRLIVSSNAPTWRSTDSSQIYWELDAPVPGAVGSAVLNDAGELVGLLGANSRVWPVDQLKPVLNDVLQHSLIQRPHFGFKFLMLSDTITPNAIGNVGAVVGADDGDQAIEAKGPADRAGLKSGDVITAVDQHALQTDLLRVLSTYHPTDQVHMTVQRAGKTLQLTLTVGSQRS